MGYLGMEERGLELGQPWAWGAKLWRGLTCSQGTRHPRPLAVFTQGSHTPAGMPDCQSMALACTRPLGWVLRGNAATALCQGPP